MTKPKNTKENKDILTKIKEKVVESLIKKAFSQSIDVIIEQQSNEIKNNNQ